MRHPISASVAEALEEAILRDDICTLADAFVEMYVLAQMGVGRQAYAVGVDEICVAILTGEVTP